MTDAPHVLETRKEVARVLSFDDAVDVAFAYERFRRGQRARAAARHRRRVFALRTCAVVAVVAFILAVPLRSFARALFRELQPARLVALLVAGRNESWSQSPYGQIRRATTFRAMGRSAWGLVSSEKIASRPDLRVRVPSLVPADVEGQRTSYVREPFGWRLRFDAAYAARSGLHLPRSLDGATIDVSVPIQAELRYGIGTVQRIGPFGKPVLVVYEARVPVLRIAGTTLDEIAAWLETEPSVPPEAARGVRVLADPLPAIPIPIHIDREHASHVHVDGSSGLAVAMPFSQSSVVAWERDGVLYAVGGTYPLDRIVTIADSLR